MNNEKKIVLMSKEIESKEWVYLCKHCNWSCQT